MSSLAIRHVVVDVAVVEISLLSIQEQCSVSSCGGSGYCNKISGCHLQISSVTLWMYTCI